MAGHSRPTASLPLAYARPSRLRFKESKTWMPGTSSAKTRFALLPGHDVQQHFSSRVRRLGVTDDALYGRERAAQRALDGIDVVMHLDHAHRRRGAAVEVDDFAGVGVAHPHAVDVVDRAIIGDKARQRRLDGFD